MQPAKANLNFKIVLLVAALGFSVEKPHSELAFVYLFGFLVILLAGAGKYSIDNKLKQYPLVPHKFFI